MLLLLRPVVVADDPDSSNELEEQERDDEEPHGEERQAQQVPLEGTVGGLKAERAEDLPGSTGTRRQ